MNDRTPHRRTLRGYITQMDRDQYTLRLRTVAPAGDTRIGLVLFEGKHAPDVWLQARLLNAFRNDFCVRCTIDGALLIEAVIE